MIWIMNGFCKCKAMYYECVWLICEICDDIFCYKMLWQVFGKYMIWPKWIIACKVYATWLLPNNPPFVYKYGTWPTYDMQARPVWVTSVIHAPGTWPTCGMQARPVGVTSGIHVPIYAASHIGQLTFGFLFNLRVSDCPGTRDVSEPLPYWKTWARAY